MEFQRQLDGGDIRLTPNKGCLVIDEPLERPRREPQISDQDLPGQSVLVLRDSQPANVVGEEIRTEEAENVEDKLWRELEECRCAKCLEGR